MLGLISTSGLRDAMEWFSWNDSLQIDKHHSKKNPYSYLTVEPSLTKWLNSWMHEL